MSHFIEHDSEHAETWDVLPWYVNARLGEAERRRVDAHVRTCAACRDELAVQRRLHEILAADLNVEQLPTAGLKRLRERIAAAAPAAQRARPSRRHRLERWQGVMAASIAVMATAVCVVAGVLWTQSHRRAPSAEYFTVTTSTPRAANEIIRAVFAPSITLSELQRVLDDAQLKIVAGPTEAGVYSLAATSARPADWSLQRLRGQPAVRFAEATVAASAAPRPQ